MPVIRRGTDWRVDFQEMRLAKLLPPRIHFFAGVQRIIVRGVNEKNRCLNVGHCCEESRSQLRRPIPAIAGTVKDYDGPQFRFFLGLQDCKRATKRVPDYRQLVCIDLGKSAQESKAGAGIPQLYSDIDEKFGKT